MIILDTNVLSAVMQQTPDPRIIAWLDRQPAESLWISSVTVFEIGFGLRLLDPGKRRDALEAAFKSAVEEDLEGRVLPFDRVAAEESAGIAARQRRAGLSVEIRDVEIAGIVAARRATLATRNTRHFSGIGINLIDPWLEKT